MPQRHLIPRLSFTLIVTLTGLLLSAEPLSAASLDDIQLALQQLDSEVLNKSAEIDPRELVRQDVRNRLRAAGARETANWRQLKSRADWEAYRDTRLAALRASLGSLAPQGDLQLRVMGRIRGDGYTIENVIFTSTAGIEVTANLYRPAVSTSRAPGIIICHSHHAPKTQGELQTMGMTWARQGALVLVMDQLGHGERRTHRFTAASAYPTPFRSERQDYYHRYNTGLQLQLVGESLSHWMVNDLRRGADVLLSLGADPERLIILGAVAGGGDPTGVAAALDSRFRVAVPFNFGGYEPEDVYPLPDNAEETFNYTGSGSWESTRNLARSAADGFLPWVIIGSIAPRKLIYAHEFRWDEPRDPVWKRLRQIYAWHDASDRLSSAVGRGTVKGQAPESSHCTNIGALHRSQLHPLFERWLSMPTPTVESTERHETAQLWCRGDEQRPEPLHTVLDSLAQDRCATAREQTAKLTSAQRRAHWQRTLVKLLGAVEPERQMTAAKVSRSEHGGLSVERVQLQRTSGELTIELPLLIVQPVKPVAALSPRTIVALAQRGKAALLKQKAETIARLVDQGARVVLVDVRGTGETQPAGEGRGRSGGVTGRSSSEWMLGQTILGQQVSDVRTVLAWLQQQQPRGSVSLWGEGLVEPNAANASLAAPLDAERLPSVSEPLGMLAALIVALYEDDVDTVFARGGLVSYRSMLDSPYPWVPHDALIPGLLAHGDIDDWLAALEGRKIWLADLRDGQNRRIDDDVPDELQAARWLLKGR